MATTEEKKEWIEKQIPGAMDHALAKIAFQTTIDLFLDVQDKDFPRGKWLSILRNNEDEIYTEFVYHRVSNRQSTPVQSAIKIKEKMEQIIAEIQRTSRDTMILEGD